MNVYNSIRLLTVESNKVDNLKKFALNIMLIYCNTNVEIGYSFKTA